MTTVMLTCNILPHKVHIKLYLEISSILTNNCYLKINNTNNCFSLLLYTEQRLQLQLSNSLFHYQFTVAFLKGQICLK